MVAIVLHFVLSRCSFIIATSRSRSSTFSKQFNRPFSFLFFYRRRLYCCGSVPERWQVLRWHQQPVVRLQLYQRVRRLQLWNRWVFIRPGGTFYLYSCLGLTFITIRTVTNPNKFRIRTRIQIRFLAEFSDPKIHKIYIKHNKTC